MIEIINKTKAQINEKILRSAAEQAISILKLEAGKYLSIALIGEAAMKRINSNCRRIERATDVLSFAGEGEELGEVLICYRVALRQAKERDMPVQSELIFLLVHALLHLSGMDDKTEEGRLRMIKRGLKIMSMLDLPKSYKAVKKYD